MSNSSNVILARALTIDPSEQLVEKLSYYRLMLLELVVPKGQFHKSSCTICMHV